MNSLLFFLLFFFAFSSSQVALHFFYFKEGVIERHNYFWVWVSKNFTARISRGICSVMKYRGHNRILEKKTQDDFEGMKKPLMASILSFDRKWYMWFKEK